jgi:Tol biopolymer transport system component
MPSDGARHLRAAAACTTNPTRFRWRTLLADLHRLSLTLADRYRIERELGAGGMATVYRGHDIKHGRDVAIKVLHPDLGAALGGERFLSEIRTTARLQHPHILPLLDSGEADGLLYYVMPLVTGETLRARLERERQLPIADAVRIAREVASALDYAHRQNVIHRDIKPENILLHDGSALVADFGIALAVQSAGGQRMTQTGLSLGTPQYMSPEQAMGERTIDARSDVYALGAMTYEMLSGEPPFAGPTVQAIVAKVLSSDPVLLVSLRKAVPANVARAVHAALEKLPADRCESAKAFADALDDTRPGLATRSTRSLPSPAAAAPSPALRVVALAGWVAALAAMMVVAWTWQRGREIEPAPVVPLMLDTPGARPDLGRFAVSGDGTRFAFSTDEGIVYRGEGQRDYRLMPGTANGESPSFSPGGDWIVYQANGRLRKIPVGGGSPISLLPADSLLAGRVSWGEDGTIVFETRGVLAVLPVRGALRLLSKAVSGEQPRMAPDGRGILYVDNRQRSQLMYYDLALDTAFKVLEESSEAQLLPTGHLLYGSTAGGIYAIRFDQARHAVEGAPSPVVLDMQQNGGVAPFTVTRNGTLVYRAGIPAKYRTLLREANGKVDTLPVALGVLSYARFSPDGRQLALTIGASRGSNRHTALYDLHVGTLTRFTREGGGHAPIWSPDGTRLVFTAEDPTTDAEDVFVQPLDRSAPPAVVMRMPDDQHASAWPSDTMLVFGSNSSPAGGAGNGVNGRARNVDIVNPVSRAPARAYLQAQWGEYDASISPDGQWAAYTSIEVSTPEIHVRRFPKADAGGQWKVSTGGGQRARWSGDGRTIYYQTADASAIRAVRVTPGQAFGVGASETILRVPNMGNAWDVDRASGRMVVTEPVVAEGARIVVMQHWLEQFRRDASAKR